MARSENGFGGSGSGPGAPRGPSGARDNVTCTAIGCTVLVLFLLVFLVGLAHPFLVLAIGALMVAVFGGALLIWRD